MMVNTRRITRDREGMSVGEEMLYVDRDGEFYDELSGSWLDPDRVKQARIEEMEEFRKHKVYEKVTIQECWDKTGRNPIGVKWVDVNKGDNSNPDYRSRLVAQEIKTDKREDLFAATPPLEAIKMVLSMAVTEGIGFKAGNRKGGVKIDFIDVRRAYSHARARREVYVNLPQEDSTPGMCGKLLKAMYGTRDAAQNWECEYVEFLKHLGFPQRKATPCVFT